jgi:hypothetical protein
MRCLEKQRDRRFGSMSELNLAVRAGLPRGERQRPRALISLAARLQEAPAGGRRRRSVLSHTTESLLRLSSHRAAGLAAAALLATSLAGGLWYMDSAPREKAAVRPEKRPAVQPVRRTVDAPPAGPLNAEPAPAGPPASEPDHAPPASPPAPVSTAPAPTTPPPAALSAGPAAPAAAAREPGYLKLVVRPWAEVKVDGRLHDVTPFEAPIPLTPGEHTIELTHETLPPRRLKVTARAGETRKLDVDLRR